jgi:DNA (cytosine-5)-methyltransferase 1
MQEHHIKDLESLLLRTPLASEAFGGAVGEAEARKRGNSVQVRDQALDLAKLQGYKVTRQDANLPTPTVSDQYTGNLASTQQKPGSMHSVTLAQVFHKPELFPTPTTRDYKDGSADHERDGKVQTDTVARAIFSSGEVALMGTPRTSSANGSTPKQVAKGAPKARIEDQVLLTNWGKFEPAIRRWEAILGRQAPEPTKPDGKDGNHRLSSKFTEWMMGLPDGWITGHDLKRNDELKLAGNGVVPQQAELALRLLLELPEIREN